MTWHVICVRSKDAQKQLARTSLRWNISWENVCWKLKNLQTFVWLGVWITPPVIQTSVNFTIFNLHFLSWSIMNYDLNITDILVVCPQIRYIEVLDITNPPFNEQIWLLPNNFVKSRFRCIRKEVFLFLFSFFFWGGGCLLFLMLHMYSFTHIMHHSVTGCVDMIVELLQV